MTESPAKILLVDDDRAILAVTEHILKVAGYEVLLAQNGAQALNQVRLEQPDLVLLDVHLPDISGYEVCRQIKSDPELEGTFVIQISASSTDSDSQAQGLEMGADGYIVRPIANRELLARVQAYLRIKIAEKKVREYSRRLEETMLERERAEATLRESESFLRAMAENYPSYISIIEKDLTVGFTSGQEFKRQNLDPAQFVGLKLEQVFGEHTPFVKENYLKAFSGMEVQFELFINDQYQYYRAVPLGNSDGEIDRIMAVVENITERKQAEESKRRYSEQLSIVADVEHSLVTLLVQESIWDNLLTGIQRLFPDVAAVFISGFDAEREMIRAVRAIQDGELVNVSELPEIPLAPEGQGTQSKVIRTHQPLIIDTDLMKKLYQKKIVVMGSNDKETISALYVPMLAQDKVLGLVQCQSYISYRFTQDDVRALSLIANTAAVSIQNARLFEMAQAEIAERKLAEEALKGSELRFATIFRSNPAAIAIAQLDNGQLIDVNETWQEFTGYKRSEVIGHTPLELNIWIDPKRREYLIEMVREHGYARDEVQLRRKTGEIYDLLISAELIELTGKPYLLTMAQDITERKRAEEDLRVSEQTARRTAEQLRMVNQIGVKITTDLDFERLLQTIYEQCQQIGDADTFYIAFYNSTTGTLSFPFNYKDGERKVFASRNIRENPGLAGHIIEHRQPLYLPDMSNLPVGLTLIRQPGIPSRSFIGIPLILGERVVGILSMQSHSPNAYSPEQIQTLELLATQVVVAIQNAQLYRHARLEVNERKLAEQALRQRVDELEMLYESGLAFSQLLDPREIGQKIIGLLEQKLNWHHIAVRLYESQKDILEVLAFSQSNPKDEKQRRETEERFYSTVIRSGEGFSGWVVQNHRGVRSGSVNHDPRYKETYAGIQSGLYVPMQSGQKVVGVISIESEKPDAFTESDQRLATTLANQAAVAIENARLNASLEQRVKERTAEVEDLYNNAPTGYHSLDENGTIIMINQTELDWLGYTREELVNIKKYRDLTTLQSQWVFDKNFPIFKAQGWMKDLEFELIRKDGSTFPVLLNATAIYDPNGKYLYSRTTIFDITERRRAEEEARKLSQAIEHGPVSVVITNRDAIIEYVNPMFCEVTGYTREEALGQTPRILKSGIHPLEYYQSMWGTLLGGHPWHGEFCNKRKNGDLFWEHASISPIRNEYGEITHYVAVKEDVTERKKAEEALRESRDKLSAANAALEKAARLKDEFLASMSHELRTPLTGILGLSEALQLKTYGELNPKQATAVVTIQESGRHLLELINDILDLSKIEAGKLELQFAPCFVGDVCQASLQLIKGMAHQKKQNVTYKPLTQPVFIRADARRLKQILVNLLSNAVKFTPEGGELGLEVWANEAERAVKIIVWDKGIGIKPEDLQKLFKPFTQLDSSLSREYSGTGLGLSLVKRLTEMHNGGIEVASVFGEGSCFTVTLPWSPNNTTPVPYRNAARGTQPLAIPDRSRLPIVLIADDNEIVLQMITDFLETQRYYIIKARNGFELLDLAVEFHPKVILVDIQMPGMDGLEAIRQIRAHTDPFVAAAYVIVITAMAMNGDRERSLLAGANEYLSKPVRLKELAAILQRQIEKK
jgi:PAS domain S-box-containing protein